MLLYRIKNWWENNIKHKIISSEMLWIDLIRLFSIPMALLAFPSIYIGLGLSITLILIAFIVFVAGIVIYYSTKDERVVLQSIIVVAIFLIMGYIFVILAETLWALYCVCAFSFLILQDWAYRIGFQKANEESFFDYIFNKSHKIFKRMIEIVTYFSIILGSIITSVKNWDNADYEKLKNQKIDLGSGDIAEQLINNPLSQKISKNNFNNSLEQSRDLLGQICDIIKNFKFFKDITQSLENFKELIEYLGLIMIGATMVSFFLPIVMRHFKELVSE